MTFPTMNCQGAADVIQSPGTKLSENKIEDSGQIGITILSSSDTIITQNSISNNIVVEDKAFLTQVVFNNAPTAGDNEYQVAEDDAAAGNIDTFIYRVYDGAEYSENMTVTLYFTL